jgi:hypothetical protein
MPSNLISRVQTSVNAQKSSFCSRSTRLTVINDPGRRPNTQDIVTYVDCEGRRNDATYREIFTNNGYINDCVQGGCSIKSTGENPNRYFVQFGTTDCNTPPPSEIRALTPCGGEQKIPVDVLGYDVTEGGVYQIPLIPLGDNPDVEIQCYTIGELTESPASYDISGQVISIGDCVMCRRRI